MVRTSRELASAQVVLRSATGRAPGGSDVITAETLHEFLPSAETQAAVTGFFRTLGFDTGALVGNSFSITAPWPIFERVFGVRLQRRKDGGIEAVTGGAVAAELPLATLPAAIRAAIAAVVFPPPPAFGPTRP